MGALLELRDVDARYGQVQVLRGISLTVDAGEIVAILGANGAGKTTTLRVISGIVRPLRGRVTFEGEDLARVSAIIPAAMPTRPAQINDSRIGSASSATTAMPAATAAILVDRSSSVGTSSERKHNGTMKSSDHAAGMTLPAQ